MLSDLPARARALASGTPVTLAAMAALATACGPARSREASPDSLAATAAAPAAARAPAARDSAWRPLFDGTSLAAWRGYKVDTVPGGWRAQDGELRLVGGGGDLVSREQFGDFELELEWKLGPRGNSGVMYRVTETGGATYTSGPEMQVLDDAGHVDGRNALTSAGALYGLYPAPRGVVRPAGQWNQARILVRGNHVEHWLNGTKTAEAEMWSPDWNRRHAASKFPAWPEYAKAARGHIALQDHGDPVAYRNIRIRSFN